MGLVVLLILFGGTWLLLIRPQQQRLRAQRNLVASLEVGDQVVTAGGMIGRITRLDDRDAAIEVAPGIILTFLRPAVSRRLDPDEAAASTVAGPSAASPGGAANANDADADAAAANTEHDDLEEGAKE